MHTPTLLLLLVVGAADSFTPSILRSRAAAPAAAAVVAALASSPSSDDSGGSGLDLSGNTWQPTEGRMHATDVGDYFPEGYVDELEFTDGLKGVSGLSHPKAGNRDEGPELPGMEAWDDDEIVNHVLGSGIQQAEGIPEGMEFVPSSVPDGEIQMRVPLVSAGVGRGLTGTSRVCVNVLVACAII